MDLIQVLTGIIEEKGLWSDSIILGRSENLANKPIHQSAIFQLESGAIRAFSLINDIDYTIRLIYGGDIFGYLDTFINGDPSSMELEALRESKVRYIRKEDFQLLLDQDKDFLKIWIELIQLLLLQFMERERDLLIASPQERLNKVLKRSPMVFQEIPHKYIASYLRMSPETLSRLKKS